MPEKNLRERIAKALLIAAAAAVLGSIFLPYWWVKVKAPQYPKGLTVTAYLNRVEGDVQEIDTLNHYIGMRSLRDAAPLEKKFAVAGAAAMALCLVAAALFRGRLSWLLVLPVIFFPAIFAADLYLWLRDFGLHLNPKAPLSSSIKPFIPPLLGKGNIAQFQATANFSWGHGLVMLAMVLSVAAMATRFIKKQPKKLQWFAGFYMAVSILCATPAFADTLVVGPGGFSEISEAVERAAAGDTVIVKPGVYHGPLVVEKTLNFVGEGGPVIDGRGRGTVVRLQAPGIRFEGFTVRGSGDFLAKEDAGIFISGAGVVVKDNVMEDVLFGIHLSRADQSRVTGNLIKGKKLDVARRGDLIRVWYSHDVVIDRNTTEGGRDVVFWFSKNLTVRGNRFKGGRYGVHFMYCQNARIEKNILSGNSVGAYLMYSQHLKLTGNTMSDNRGPSGFGIGFKDMEFPRIENNTVINNRVGLFLDSSARGIYRKNLVAANDVGAQVSPMTARNRFVRNNFIDNNEQVLTEGKSIHTVNQWSGNYWSDYRGFDADQDGTGDVPYRPMRFFERLTDRLRNLRIFFGSPSVHAIDFAASTFPIFAPAPKFTDERPRMAPVAMPLRPKAPGAASGWFWASGILLIPALGFLKGLPVPSFKKNIPSASAEEPAAIRIRGVSKRYGAVQALKAVDLEIARGQAVALWGPNGAGKTTLLKCLLGLVPFEGEIRLMGLDVKKDGKEARALIGYVPQEIRLHLDQSVRETVGFYAALRGVGAGAAKKLLAEWGLASSAKQLAQNLSGGMKQKLALVIALLSDPPVLFLDEPTSNLDVGARDEFDRALERLKHSGKTIIFCSHRYAEVKKIADKVILLGAGVKKAEGKPDEVRPLLGALSAEMAASR